MDCKNQSKPPKLTVVVVTEQTQYSLMQYLSKYLKGGLGLLWHKGINYTNATMSHNTVDTAPSHSGWSTGAYSSTHGIVDNEFDVNGIEQYTADDYTETSPQNLVYVPNTSLGNPAGQVYPLTHPVTYGVGEANKYMMCDTLADQMVMHSTPDNTKEFYFVTNVGPGDDPANVVPGQLGKTFFFDELVGGYTSSQAWFPGAFLKIEGANGSGYGALAALTVVDGQITLVIWENGGINYQEPIVLTAVNPTYTKTGVQQPPIRAATFSYTMQTQLQFTGSINNTTLTVTTAPNTPIVPGIVLGSVGGVTAGTVIISQLSGTTGGIGTYQVSISQTLAGPVAMSQQFGGVIASISVVDGGDGYIGGLPNWVTKWNNKQNFISKTSWTNQLTYPIDSPCYTNIPLSKNFSWSASLIGDTYPGSSTIGETIPITYEFPNTPPLQQQNGSGATAIVYLAAVAQFTGYIDGTTLTVLTMISGAIAVRNMIQIYMTEPGLVPTGIPLVLPNTEVISFGSGTTGGVGSYTVYQIQTAGTQTVGSASGPVTFIATNGTIAPPLLTNGGQNYTYSEDYTGVTVTGIREAIVGSPAPGQPAKAYQALVDSATTNGVVTSLELTNPGLGYGSNPNIFIYPVESSSVYLPFYNYPFQSYDALANLFSFTKRLIKERKEVDELVVFLNPFINHDPSFYHGNFAIDTLDSYYQYDLQMGKFFDWIYKHYDPSDVLLGWVTCEGNFGVYNYWKQAGYRNIFGNDLSQIIGAIDEAVYAVTGLTKIAAKVSISDVWFSATYFKQTAAVQQQICEIAVAVLRNFSGVKNAYITHELLNGKFIPQTMEESFLILEAFPGRSGQLKYLAKPMGGVAEAPIGYGTYGSTSWDSGCHSPFCLYQKGVLEHKIIREPVQLERFPLTLAEILQVPRPTGGSRLLGPLPGIFNKDGNMGNNRFI